MFKADNLGALAGLLCFIHCMATPFVFVVKACSDSCCSDSPVWWKSIDYVFLIISFGAIYFATRNSSIQWIKGSLWGFWLLLLIVILNESFGFITLSEYIIYIPALAIVGLHLYNRRYSTCVDDECCNEG